MKISVETLKKINKELDSKIDKNERQEIIKQILDNPEVDLDEFELENFEIDFSDQSRKILGKEENTVLKDWTILVMTSIKEGNLIADLNAELHPDYKEFDEDDRMDEWFEAEIILDTGEIVYTGIGQGT